MPSKLNKVQKSVHKKKGAKINSLHENSRDAMRLRKASARDDRVQRTHTVQKKQNIPWTDRVTFFQDNLPDTLHPLEVEQIQSIIVEFINRNDEELDQLKAERRTGRPASTRQTLLEQQRVQERGEHESGFWVPDVRDEQILEMLDAWKGDWLSLANLRFIRVQADGIVKESQFPPKDLNTQSTVAYYLVAEDPLSDSHTSTASFTYFTSYKSGQSRASDALQDSTLSLCNGNQSASSHKAKMPQRYQPLPPNDLEAQKLLPESSKTCHAKLEAEKFPPLAKPLSPNPPATNSSPPYRPLNSHQENFLSRTIEALWIIAIIIVAKVVDNDIVSRMACFAFLKPIVVEVWFSVHRGEVDKCIESIPDKHWFLKRVVQAYWFALPTLVSVLCGLVVAIGPDFGRR